MTRREALATAVLLCVLSAAIYAAVGFSFREEVLYGDDVLFDADAPRVIGDLTGGPTATYYRSSVHPLVLLLLGAPGRLLHSAGLSPARAAMFVGAFTGGLAVALAYLYFLRVVEGRVAPLLYAALVGASFAHVSWS